MAVSSSQIRQNGTGTQTVNCNGVLRGIVIGSAAATAVIEVRQGTSTGNIIFTATPGTVAVPLFIDMFSLRVPNGIYLSVATAAADVSLLVA